MLHFYRSVTEADFRGMAGMKKVARKQVVPFRVMERQSAIVGVRDQQPRVTVISINNGYPAWAEKLTRAVASVGRLRIPIGSPWPLSSAAEALAAVPTSHTGKIIVTIGEPSRV